MKQTAGNAQVCAVPNGDFKPVYVESKFKKRYGKTSLFLIAIQRNEAESGRKMQGADAIGVFGEGIYADNRIIAVCVTMKIPKAELFKKSKVCHMDVINEIGDVPLKVATN